MSITIRHYGKDDFNAVAALHAKQGLDYAMPDLDSDNMLVRVVIEDEGRITHAVLLRKTCEAYWIFDPTADRVRERLQKFFMIHKEVIPQARIAGFEDMHCWLPPHLAERKALDGTMMRLGWSRPLWTCYNRRTT